MKTEVRINEKLKNIKYPLVAIAKKNKHVVLFTSEHEGFKLTLGEVRTTYSIGYHSDIFDSCFDEDFWEIPEEITITFKNE